jgi:hypothetical protein
MVFAQHILDRVAGAAGPQAAEISLINLGSSGWATRNVVPTTPLFMES